MPTTSITKQFIIKNKKALKKIMKVIKCQNKKYDPNTQSSNSLKNGRERLKRFIFKN